MRLPPIKDDSLPDKREELLAYLKAHGEHFEDDGGKLRVRCNASAELLDGVILPRVIFTTGRVTGGMADVLIKKAGEREEFLNTLDWFVTRAQIEPKHIRKILPSRYACPPRIRDALSDPVERMEYAHFALEMKDGKKLYFDLDEGETFYGPPEFLTLPEPYGFQDVVKIFEAEHAPKGERVIRYGAEPVFYCHL